jgi:hypothetical protein
MAMGSIAGSGGPAALAIAPTLPTSSTATHILLPDKHHSDRCWRKKDGHEWCGYASSVAGGSLAPVVGGYASSPAGQPVSPVVGG